MADKELELLCIGNALIDLFANGEEGIDYGLTQSVQHIEIEKLKKILLLLSDSVTVSGGGAANVAKVAGYLGAKVSFTGAVGCEGGGDSGKGVDDFGQLFAGQLRPAAVKLRLAEKPSPTGVCLMLRIGEKTQIAASPSAALELSEGDISEGDIKAAQVVVIDGFMLQRPGLVRRILAFAGKHETVAAIDIGSAAIASERAAEIAAYTEEYPLILFMNEEEARAFCEGLNDELHSSLRASVRDNCKKFPIIVVKLAGRGAVCYAGGKSYSAGTEAVTPLESTGAGDAFCAGFLTAWVRGKPIPECAALGNKAAGIMLNVMGTQISGEEKKSLARLLEPTAPP